MAKIKHSKKQIIGLLDHPLDGALYIVKIIEFLPPALAKQVHIITDKGVRYNNIEKRLIIT